MLIKIDIYFIYSINIIYYKNILLTKFITHFMLIQKSYISSVIKKFKSLLRKNYIYKNYIHFIKYSLIKI